MISSNVLLCVTVMYSRFLFGKVLTIGVSKLTLNDRLKSRSKGNERTSGQRNMRTQTVQLHGA